MKQSRFKSLLSYVTEMHIETISSEYNEELHVVLKNGRYQLCTPNAIYSYGDKYGNFKGIFEQIDFQRASIQNVLLLGFGLGSIPFMLEKKFGKLYSYTGIEIDEAIIYLASKYVLDELKADIELIQADANYFIMQANSTYDMICIDIFVDDKIPEVFLDIDFLYDVQDNLASNGFIIFNHLAYNENDKRAADDYYTNVFEKVFPNGASLKIKGNCMMISDRSKLR